jgi:hypothetical protein
MRSPGNFLGIRFGEASIGAKGGPKYRLAGIFQQRLKIVEPNEH